jgi:hypothetical protein
MTRIGWRLALLALVCLLSFGAGRWGVRAPRRFEPVDERSRRGPTSTSVEIPAPRTEPATDDEGRVESEPVVDRAPPLIARIDAVADWAEAFRVGQAIVGLPAAEGGALMRRLYASIESPRKRRGLFKGLTQSGPCAYLLDVLDAARRDSDPVLVSAGDLYVEALTLLDFRGRDGSYEEWWRANSSASPAALFRAGQERLVKRLSAAHGPALLALLQHYVEMDGPQTTLARASGLSLFDEARASGLCELLGRLVGDERVGFGVRIAALSYLGRLYPAREILEPVVRPILARPAEHPAGLVEAAAEVLWRQREGWIVDPLVGALGAEQDRRLRARMIDSLAEGDDERAIPLLLAQLGGERNRTRYRVAGSMDVAALAAALER